MNTKIKKALSLGVLAFAGLFALYSCADKWEDHYVSGAACSFNCGEISRRQLWIVEYTGTCCSFICTKISRCQPQIFHLHQNLSLPQDFKLQFSGQFTLPNSKLQIINYK